MREHKEPSKVRQRLKKATEEEENTQPVREVREQTLVLANYYHHHFFIGSVNGQKSIGKYLLATDFFSG